jgi:hypothetical protein
MACAVIQSLDKGVYSACAMLHGSTGVMQVAAEFELISQKWTSAVEPGSVSLAGMIADEALLEDKALQLDNMVEASLLEWSPKDWFEKFKMKMFEGYEQVLAYPRTDETIGIFEVHCPPGGGASCSFGWSRDTGTSLKLGAFGFGVEFGRTLNIAVKNSTEVPACTRILAKADLYVADYQRVVRGQVDTKHLVRVDKIYDNFWGEQVIPDSEDLCRKISGKYCPFSYCEDDLVIEELTRSAPGSKPSYSYDVASGTSYGASYEHSVGAATLTLGFTYEFSRDFTISYNFKPGAAYYGFTPLVALCWETDRSERFPGACWGVIPGGPS